MRWLSDLQQHIWGRWDASVKWVRTPWARCTFELVAGAVVYLVSLLMFTGDLKSVALTVGLVLFLRADSAWKDEQLRELREVDRLHLKAIEHHREHIQKLMDYLGKVAAWGEEQRKKREEVGQ